MKDQREGLCPRITQMNADKALFSSVSASICVNLRTIPDSVAVGRAGLLATFCGYFIVSHPADSTMNAPTPVHCEVPGGPHPCHPKLTRIAQDDILAAIRRHQARDWGGLAGGGPH